MPNTDWRLCGSGANVPFGSGVDWTSPGNITADDGASAVGATTQFVGSDYLGSSAYGFSLEAAGITGFEMRYRCSGYVGGATSVSTGLTKGGVVIESFEKAMTVADGIYTLGGPNDTWGTGIGGYAAFSTADVAASTFGTLTHLAADGVGAITWNINAIWLRIYLIPLGVSHGFPPHGRGAGW